MPFWRRKESARRLSHVRASTPDSDTDTDATEDITGALSRNCSVTDGTMLLVRPTEGSNQAAAPAGPFGSCALQKQLLAAAHVTAPRDVSSAGGRLSRQGQVDIASRLATLQLLAGEEPLSADVLAILRSKGATTFLGESADSPFATFLPAGAGEDAGLAAGSEYGASMATDAGAASTPAASREGSMSKRRGEPLCTAGALEAAQLPSTPSGTAKKLRRAEEGMREAEHGLPALLRPRAAAV